MAKITYDDKVAVNENTAIPDINKCKAEDMNEIKNVVNENDDIVSLQSNYIKVTTNIGSQASSNFIVLLNQVDIINGNKLTLNSNDNAIIVGEGVHHIMVSGAIFLNGSFARNGYCWGEILRNGSNSASSLAYIPQGASFQSSPIPISIIDVSVGDKIKLQADSTAGGTIRTGSQNTWLMAKVID